MSASTTSVAPRVVRSGLLRHSLGYVSWLGRSTCSWGDRCRPPTHTARVHAVPPTTRRSMLSSGAFFDQRVEAEDSSSMPISLGGHRMARHRPVSLGSTPSGSVRQLSAQPAVAGSDRMDERAKVDSKGVGGNGGSTFKVSVRSLFICPSTRVRWSHIPTMSGSTHPTSNPNRYTRASTVSARTSGRFRPPRKAKRRPLKLLAPVVSPDVLLALSRQDWEVIWHLALASIESVAQNSQPRVAGSRQASDLLRVLASPRCVRVLNLPPPASS